MQRVHRTSGRFHENCPLCDGRLYFQTAPSEILFKCKKCNQIKKLVTCNTEYCKFRNSVCANCSVNSLEFEQSSCGFPANPCRRWIPTMFGITTVFLILLVALIAHFISSSKGHKNVDVNILFEKLKESYPSQRNETWYHFLSVLEETNPSVKSITLLYNEEKTTVDCLINELVLHFNGNISIKTEDIMFSSIEFEGEDYGLALKHYWAVVKKFRLLITNLSEVSGKFARVFHSLCDEVSSDIKPSLFIFTLKCDSKTQNLKPLKKATTILQEIWSDLQNNEFSSLLSRVIKNVVEIIPETGCPCCIK